MRARQWREEHGEAEHKWKTVFCSSPPYILSGVVGLKQEKEVLLSSYLDYLPAPKGSEQLLLWNLKY